MRRDIKGGVMAGVMGSTYTLSGGTSIVDPQMRQQVLLDTETKVARIADFNAAGQALAGARLATEAEREELIARAKAAGATAGTAPRAIVAPLISGDGQTSVISAASGIYNLAPTSKYETRSEDLGTRDFDGVTAEGRRTTTIIPAGAIGNAV